MANSRIIQSRTYFSKTQSTFFILLLFSKLTLGESVESKESETVHVSKGLGRLTGKIYNSKGLGSERKLGDAPNTEPEANAVVYIYKGSFRLKTDESGHSLPGFVDFKGEEPIRIVQADSQGVFRIDLPPDQYSVFVMRDSQIEPLEGQVPISKSALDFISFEVTENMSRDVNVVLRPFGSSEFLMVIHSTL